MNKIIMENNTQYRSLYRKKKALKNRQDTK